MTRTKKYLKAKGFKFSEDYPMLPYEDGPVTVEEVDVKFINDRVYIVKLYTSLTMVYELERTGLTRLVETREWEGINEDTYKYSDYEYEEAFGLADEYYTPSATHGDYSPSCPWNAPGMSISDFI